MSNALLEGISEAIKLARDFARCGNYETALIYFDGAMSKIHQYDVFSKIHLIFEIT
jgi:hypothetical protein